MIFRLFYQEHIAKKLVLNFFCNLAVKKYYIYFRIEQGMHKQTNEKIIIIILSV